MLRQPLSLALLTVVSISTVKLCAQTFPSGNERVEHSTPVGIVVCHDPQIPFSEKDWLIAGRPQESMLVSLLTEKIWLRKDRVYIDKLFNGRKDESASKTAYSFITWAKCGQQPMLYVEVEFDKEGKVSRYRSVYRPNGVNPPAIESRWIE